MKGEDITMTKLIPLNEAADMLSVTTQTIRDYINKGQLPAHRLGRKLLIHPADLDKLLKPAHPLTKPTKPTK